MIPLRGLARRPSLSGPARLLPALVGIVALGFAMVEVREATALRDHSDQVLVQSNDVERKVVDLETGLRGYAITRDAVFLRPMLVAQRQIPDDLERLEELARGNPAQERRAEAISTEVWAYARYWLKPALKLNQAHSGLAAQMWASVGRERMEFIRQRFAVFERGERDLRAERADRVATYERLVVGIFVGTVLALLGAWALSGRRLRRRDAEARDALTAALEATAVRSGELAKELERLGSTDELTGLANRRAFVERLERECTAARRHGGDLSLVLVDLDRLKQVNDAHGQAVGDAVLVRVAERCTLRRRGDDVVARIGGDRFAILLPRTPARGAEAVAAELERRIADEPIAVGSVKVAVRASIGVSSAAHGADPDTLLKAADSALRKQADPAPHLAALPVATEPSAA